MARTVSDLNIFSLTQLADPSLFGFNHKDFIEALTTHNTAWVAEFFVWLLENNGPSKIAGGASEPTGWIVEEAYVILHDKDVREIWDEKLMRNVIEVKPEHFHCSFKFKKGANVGANINNIAHALTVEPQYVEKPKAGRFAWDNQLAYLIHAKDIDKHQYDPSEVYSYRGKPYIEIYQESKERWERGAIKKQNIQAQEDIDWLESAILQGKLTKSEVILTDDYYKIYSLYKRRIDDAFDTFGQRKMYKALQRLENGDFKTSVFYVMGKPGRGKTSFAWELARQVQEKARVEMNEDWTVCSTAATNPVDDYQGQEILLMDDARGNAMRADDWLKLLDPWHASPASARYRNKVVVANTIIITSTIPPAEFFYYTKGVGQGTAQAEAIDQFLRRLLAVVEVINFDEIISRRAEKLPEGESNYFLVGRDNFGNYLRTRSEFSLDKIDDETFQNMTTAASYFADEIIQNNQLNGVKK